MMKVAFVNDEFVNTKDAKISVFDRGFLFGDSVYEVLPVYNGKAYFVQRHLDRLNSNLHKIKIKIPDINWQQLIDELIVRNGSGDLQIYLQITRGNQEVRKHDIPADIVPSVIAFTIHNNYPTYQEKEKGLHAHLIEDTRWLRCDIKTTSLLANILLNDEAVSAQAQTAILQRDNVITEGSTSNVFIITQDGEIKTSPLNQNCLPGITRQVAIELMQQKLGWQVLENTFSSDELFSAREVWITSTTKEIYPVVKVNNLLINSGKTGEYWRAVEPLYQQLIS